MKRVWYSLFIYSYALLAMEKSVKQQLEEMDVDVAKIEFDISEIKLNPSKIGRIHCRDEVETSQIHYWALYGKGSVSATLRSITKEISCKKTVKFSHCDSDVLDNELDESISSAHYHLLRMLYDAQERKKAK